MGYAARVALFAAVVTTLALAPAAHAAAYTKGNVFVSVGSGTVNEYTPTGTLVQTLDTTLGGFTTGSAFDAAGNFYVTAFSASTVSKFDATGTLVGPFGSGYNSSPESIVFDKTGNVYVGQATGSGDILKFDSSGTSLASFDTPRSDWIDLASDQCTMFFTGEGSVVGRWNVCTNTDLADFASGLTGGSAFALRILPDGGALVADSTKVVRLDASGNEVQSYTEPGESGLFALNLDPDGKSFWTADFNTADVMEFDIATGVRKQKWNTGTGGNSVFGLSVNGEITVAKSETIALTPQSATNKVGSQHCVTATVKLGADPESGSVVRFGVSGANTASGSQTTGADGKAQFCYTGLNSGDDTITAYVDDNSNNTQDPGEPGDSASKTWTGAPLPADLSLTKADSPDPVDTGATLTYKLTVKNNGPGQATGVSVEDTLPSGVTFQSVASSKGSCSRAGRTITCGIGTLASGATATVTIKVVPQESGTLTNSASVKANQSDSSSGNNSASARTTVQGAPPPVERHSVNASASGDVTVKCPGKPKQTLGGKEKHFPLGCLFDATNGRVFLDWDDGCKSNGLDSGRFGGKPFVPTQSSDPRPGCAKGLILDLDVRDPQPTRCDDKDNVSEASLTGPFDALSKRRRVRSRHHHSSGTVRGTHWQVQERCDGTLTRVLEGVVAVRDFRRHKTILVHAGHSYLARVPGGGPDGPDGPKPVPPGPPWGGSQGGR